MNLLARLKAVEQAIDPAPRHRGPCAGLAERMRARAHELRMPVTNPRPDGLAYRMQQRATNHSECDLA